MKTSITFAPLCLGLVLAGCSGEAPSGSTLELGVSYPSGLGLDHLVLSGELPLDPPRSVRADVPSPPRLLDDAGESLVIALPESVSGSVELMVEGWAQDVLRARATVQVEPASGAASVVLKLVETSTCAAPPCGPVETCGDGALAAPEACDDGDRDPGDGCDASCDVESGWRCAGEPSVCEPDCADGCESCGDGVVDATEGCDDADRISSDGCNVICQVEPGWSCSGAPSVCAPVCGDGLLVEGEGCDDTGRDPGDGCSASCQVETGFACTGEPSECAAVCGDGRVLGAETCDDEGTADGDGCSASCLVEDGFECQGAPSRCAATCGDGLVRGDEQCDDDGRRNGDGCNNRCEVERGYVCSGEPSVCVPEGTDAGVPLDAGTVDPDAEVLDAPDAGVDLDAAVADADVLDAGSALPADRLVFLLSGPASFTAGACAPVVLQRQDATGLPSNELVARSVTLSLTSGSGAALHADAACSTQLMMTTLPSGVADQTLYVRGDVAGAFVLEASAAGVTPAELAGTVSGASPVTIAVVSGPASLDWSACAATPIQIELHDAFGNLATSTRVHTLSVSTSPPGAFLVAGNPSCNNATAEISLPSGDNTASAYVLSLRSGPIVAELAGGGLASATATVTVNDATGSCATCPNSGACTVSGSGATSNVACDNRCACQLDCGATANDCRPVCGDRSTCEIDCTDRLRCEALCETRGTCIVACDGTPECDRVDCQGTASCMLDCGTSASCAFRTCAAGQMTCPNNVVVCNRDCP